MIKTMLFFLVIFTISYCNVEDVSKYMPKYDTSVQCTLVVEEQAPIKPNRETIKSIILWVVVIAWVAILIKTW